MIRARNPWWVVTAAVFGLICSSGPVNIWTFGVFLLPISQSLHIGRSVLGGALFLGGVTSAILSPFAGALLDRFGARVVILVGFVLFASVMALQSLMTATIAVVYLLFALRSVGSTLPSPTAFAFVVTRWFDRQRGLALGIALSGVGIGTSIIPPIAAYLIQHYGWRAAFVGVGVTILVLGGLPSLLLVREPDANERKELPHLADATLPGMTLREAMTGSWRFWALAVAFFLGIVVLNGTLTQVVPMLKDRGYSLEAATGVLAFSGLAAVVGRLTSGWCADRFHGPFVAIGFFILLLIGVPLIISGLPQPAPLVGVLLCGLANGSEVDLMGLFVSRYFGIRQYGTILGTMFAMFLASTGLGPFISTRTFDLYHSYAPAFHLYEGFVVVAIVLFSLVGPYRYPAAHRRAPTATGEGASA